MMNKIIMLFLMVTGVSFSSQAQNNSKAKAILAEVSKKYKSYNLVKAEFTFTLENPKTKVKETEKGTLYVKANANKYKMIMRDRDLISDGKTQWNYLKDDKEVQVSAIDNSSDALNPAQIFTIYEKGYQYAYEGETRVGTKVYQIINLTPLDAKKPYSKVRLSIDKKVKQISNVLIYDKNGSKYTYSIKSFIPNVKVPETTFTFDAKKYPGVEIVDLR